MISKSASISLVELATLPSRSIAFCDAASSLWCALRSLFLSDTVSVSSLNPCLQERYVRWLRALGTFCQAVFCAAHRIWLPLGA